MCLNRGGLDELAAAVGILFAVLGRLLVCMAHLCEQLLRVAARV